MTIKMHELLVSKNQYKVLPLKMNFDECHWAQEAVMQKAFPLPCKLPAFPQ